MTTTTVTLPERSEVDPADCWDLSTLYSDEAAWETEFEQLAQAVPALASFQGRLAESADTLAAFIDADIQAGRTLHKLYNYAGRRSDEDTANSHCKGMQDRVMVLQVQLQEATSFMRPELIAIADERMSEFLAAETLAPYRFLLERLLRHKPHTLSGPEERILAMTAEMAQAPYDAFSQLNNADMRFGTISNEDGDQVEVTHGGYLSYLSRPDRTVRKAFFDTYYQGFEEHKHTLAATLQAAIKRDVFYAKVSNHESARRAALFENNVPEAVYDNLIGTVQDNLEVLHRYYELRKRTLGLDEIRFYDIFVPMVSQIECDYPYQRGVQLLHESLAPLGEEYRDALRGGLLGGWVDRYENRGKQAGAYSAGCYDSDPFILMNYRADTLDSVYTLTHEAGHSMHTHLSTTHQPPQYANYSIFVAEVASTFNECLLTRHLLQTNDDPRFRAYLVNRAIDDLRGTLFRQTMFAEFELRIHGMVENNKPLTLDTLTGVYREILQRYYGPGFTLDPQLDLECLRIPHFYYNFYVFQYATGVSAAIALSRKVLEGGDEARESYLRFLGAGGSVYPIEALHAAGVDMASPEPVEAALTHFGALVDELEQALGDLAG